MKKVLFLMILPFLILGTAVVNGQVRIGGDTEPNGAAVLDLNASDGENGTLGLALPRVSLGALSGDGAKLNGTTPLNGMLVYNASGGLEVGLYYWVANKWVRLNDCTAAPERPGAITINPKTVERGQTFKASIGKVIGATGYTWNEPDGLEIVDGQGTLAVTYMATAAGIIEKGAITVYAKNACGDSEQSVGSGGIAIAEPGFGYILDNLIIALNDVEDGTAITWLNASDACHNYGGGDGTWRLPTTEDLKKLEGYLDLYGMSSECYWTNIDYAGAGLYWCWDSMTLNWCDKACAPARCVRLY
jgi:hypothetical protein